MGWQETPQNLFALKLEDPQFLPRCLTVVDTGLVCAVVADLSFDVFADQVSTKTPATASAAPQLDHRIQRDLQDRKLCIRADCSEK